MNKYEGVYGTTQEGIIRSGFMFDTFPAEFYLDDDLKIIGLKSNHINGGETIGTESENIVKKLCVGNMVKGIIENQKFDSITELFNELNIAYKQRLLNIISLDPNRYITYEEQQMAA